MQFPQSQCCNNSYTQSYSGCGCQYPIVPGSNPAIQTWNGQNFIVADGSTLSPISLPFLQQTTKANIQFVVGITAEGTLTLVPVSSFA